MSEEKEVKTTRKRAKSEPEKPKTLVYCGPSLRDLQQYSVFLGEFPQYVKNHIENAPVLNELFVAPKNLALTSKRLSEIGTRENQLYKKALEYARGGNN